MATSFEVNARNKVLRMAKRGVYDRDEVYRIVDAGLVCHVGYEVDGQPYVMPTLHARDGDDLLLHGHGTSRTVLHAGAGNPVCVTVTLADGLVLARSVFNHSINYRSATLYGTGSLITDPDEKMAALFRFSERLMPGRWDEVRAMNDQEFKATAIARVAIESASAKVREGMPKDEPEDVDFPVWGGIVPLRLVAADPVPDEHTPPGMSVPENVLAWVEDRR